MSIWRPVASTSPTRAGCSFYASISLIALGALACKSNEAPAPPPTTTTSPARPRSPDAAIIDAPFIDASVAVTIDATAAAKAEAGDFVDVTALDASLVLDMRYATSNNFAKRAVYPAARCLLRRAIAERLVRAQAALVKRGYGLLLWDCYRPFSVQEAFWKLVPDSRYVARPARKDGVPHKGSKHNRGAAVDISLVTARGDALEMPTDHDDFSERAHRSARRWSARARAHADILSAAMVAEGFATIETEWWHFDGPGWQGFELADEPLVSPDE